MAFRERLGEGTGMVWRILARSGSAIRYGSALLVGLALQASAEAQVWKSPLGRPAARVSAEDELEALLSQSMTTVQAGTSSQGARRTAQTELPLGELSPEARSKAEALLQEVGLFRRLPTLSFVVEPVVYQHLLRSPVTAVSTWRAMEISKLRLEQTGPGRFHADAQDGSVGEIEVWKQTETETLIYCSGAFKSPVLTKPIIARSLMHLRAKFATDPQGISRVEHTGDVFVEFPSQTVETVAKVIAPVSHSIADRNFRQLSLYVYLMSQAMERHPDWVRSIAAKMDASADDKAAFVDVCERVRVQAERRALGLQTLPVDQILAPLQRSLRDPGVPMPPIGVQTASGPMPSAR